MLSHCARSSDLRQKCAPPPGTFWRRSDEGKTGEVAQYSRWIDGENGFFCLWLAQNENELGDYTCMR